MPCCTRCASALQAKNGLYIRMALLKVCLEDSLHARQGRRMNPNAD